MKCFYQLILFVFQSDNTVDQIVINVSPIVYGHVLLVPNVTACQPQVNDLSRTRLYFLLFFLLSSIFI